MQMLNNQVINAPTVLSILKDVSTFTPMQRYYHTPILLLLIKMILADRVIDMSDLRDKLLIPPVMELGMLAHRHQIEDVDLLREELDTYEKDFDEVDGGAGFF